MLDRRRNINELTQAVEPRNKLKQGKRDILKSKRIESSRQTDVSTLK